jgi:two-component system cell cycle response regulator
MEVETRARDTLVRANSKLETDALTDPLTSLGNRRRLEQETDAIIVAARRRDWAVAVLVLDIDHFKHINDRWGHVAGDAVLRAVASVCAEHLREHDLLVRWGGEEFMVVLPRCDAAAATLVASRILDAVRSATMLPDGSDAVTASIGIAQLHATESSFTEAIRRADAAMYRAKAAGRDRYEVHAERSPAA